MERSVNDITRVERAGIRLDLGGETFELAPERAVVWASRKMVIVADLHLGKAETIACEGVPMPVGIVERDLSRLSALTDRTGFRDVLVLGDLLHAPAGIVPSMIDRVGAWIAARGVRLSVVPGNHDRRIDRVAEAWNLRVLGERHRIGGIAFTHDPALFESREPESRDAESRDGGTRDAVEDEHSFAWCGHVHPAAKIRGMGDSLRLPCFVIDGRVGVLPAFSAFTGGVVVPAAEHRRRFVVGGNRVVELDDRRAVGAAEARMTRSTPSTRSRRSTLSRKDTAP